TGSFNQRGRVSNRDFPAPYRPGRPEGRADGMRPGRGSSFPFPSRSGNGYAKASQADRYGRSAGGRSSGGQHSSRSSRSLRDLGRSLWGGGEPGTRGSHPRGRGAAYSPPRAPPGRGRSRRGGERAGGSGAAWSDQGTAGGRSVSRFGTGVRDIRDDLRERLRRNGVRGDWDTPDARPRRQRGGDWGGPGGPDGGEPRRKGSWWRHWTWKKALTIVAGLIGGVVMLAAAGGGYHQSEPPHPPAP